MNRINFLNLKLSSDRLVILPNGFLKLPNLHMLIKQKSTSLPRNLALETFGKLLIAFWTKVYLLPLLYQTTQQCCLLHLIKQNCFLKTFLRTLILMTQISFYVFPSQTNLKLHNISVTPKMVKMVMKSLDFSLVTGPDCIQVVVLKNCEPDLLYIVAEIFNVCLEDSCFPDCWKVSLVIPILRNIGERPMAKNYCPVNLLSVLSKVFEKLNRINNRIVDHLDK